MIYKLTIICINFIRIESTILFIRTWSLLIITNWWDNTSSKTKWVFYFLLVTTIFACKTSISCFNRCFTGWCYNSLNNYNFRYLTAIQISQNRWIFIRMNLYLEFWEFLHFRVWWIINIILVDNFYCFFKNSNINVRLSFQISD